ncbi:hypothetical protein ACIBQ3_32375 [Streptomyces rubiginosohelvolus]|uniref:hypothetical protein n=1 Tax=Streptomyces rubiginosohelvolus TaxID=67362 RepID=UPI00379FA879
MSSELRRQLREALGPEIKGLQRAVALEIADDARYDDEWRFDAARGRRSKVRLADLVRWTGAKDELSVREMLRRLAVAGWEFRLPIGTGRDGRPLYAVPGVAMQFRVPDFEAQTTVGPCDPEGPTTVGPLASEGPTVVAEGPTTVGEGPTVVGPHSPPLLLASPQDSPSSSGLLPSAGDESAGQGGGGGDSLHQDQDRGAATGTPELHPQAEPFVAALDFRGRPPGSKQLGRLVALAADALDAGWVEQDLKTYLDLGGAAVNSAAAVYAHRLAADELPDPATFREAARRPLEGTDAVVDGWMQLAGRSGPHRPYQDPWRRLEEEGRNGSRPQGWERVPHCGDPDCDQVTRRRDALGHDGLPTTTLCQRCHPAMRF